MEPWVRRYNYIEDYFKFAYELYRNEYPAMPCTYYSLDFENSVMDKEILDAGAYERFGLGNLSGLKWKKILMLPVWNIDQVQPTYESSEKGLILQDSEWSQVTFPSTYGIKASELDFVLFEQDFAQTDLNIKPLFVVTQINMAHYGDYFNMWQCRLKVVHDRLSLEKQISSYWMFLEYSKMIYPAENANILLKLERKNKLLTDNLYSMYNENVGFYFKLEEVH
jgi:hypothetical protein